MTISTWRILLNNLLILCLSFLFFVICLCAWRRCIECLKFQVSFCKRATHYRALLRKYLWYDSLCDMSLWGLDMCDTHFVKWWRRLWLDVCIITHLHDFLMCVIWLFLGYVSMTPWHVSHTHHSVMATILPWCIRYHLFLHFIWRTDYDLFRRVICSTHTSVSHTHHSVMATIKTWCIQSLSSPCLLNLCDMTLSGICLHDSLTRVSHTSFSHGDEKYNTTHFCV